MLSGLSKQDFEKTEKRIGEIPFDSAYKFMATRHKVLSGSVVYAKGAPEKILDMSTYVDVGTEDVATYRCKEKGDHCTV